MIKTQFIAFFITENPIYNYEEDDQNEDLNTFLCWLFNTIDSKFLLV